LTCMWPSRAASAGHQRVFRGTKSMESGLGRLRPENTKGLFHARFARAGRVVN